MQMKWYSKTTNSQSHQRERAGMKTIKHFIPDAFHAWGLAYVVFSLANTAIGLWIVLR